MSAPVATPATPFVSASLYVGDLAPEVTENDLNEKFSQVGVISSIRLCRDSVTRRSLGYGYVNFNAPSDAERAIQILNFTELKGKLCRVCWSQRDPTIRRSGLGNTFVKNLANTVDSKRLFDEFSRFGNILSVKVGADHAGTPLGYGFVHFETQDVAQEAINASKNQGMVIDGSAVVVEVYAPKARAVQAENFTNVYVKNVPLVWTNEEFQKYFAASGSITSALLKRDAEGNSLGFGFVNFSTHEEAKNAIAAAHNASVQDGDMTKSLFCCRALPKSELVRQKAQQTDARRVERQQQWAGCNLYIKFLPDTMNDEQLRVKFAEFGEVTSAKLVQTQDGMNTGVAFVCYANPEAAGKAINAMNGAALDGTRRLYVSLHQSKAIREQNQRSYSGYNNGGFPPRGPMQQPKFGYMGMMPMHGQQRNGPRMGRPHGMRRPQGNFPPMHAGQQQPRGPRTNQPRPRPAMVDPFKNIHTMPGDAQKQLLGEHLYPQVVSALGDDQTQAPKITGMLLEMDVTDVIRTIQDQEIRSAKINEALTVLAEAQN